MSTNTPLTFQKLDPLKPAFLELPEDIRYMIYLHYFADNKREVCLHLSNGVVLPCEEESYFRHVIQKSLKRPGSTMDSIGQNTAVALLLVCKAIHEPAMKQLYEDKNFTFSPSVDHLLEVPLTIISNMRHLEVDHNRPWVVLTGRIDTYELSDPEKFLTQRHAKVLKAWSRLLKNGAMLKTLQISLPTTEDCLDLYRHWAEQALFTSAHTRVMLKLYVNDGTSYRVTNPTSADVFEWMLTRICLPMITSSRTIPAVDEMILSGSFVSERTVLEFKFGGCHLVKIAEEVDHHKWKQHTYEIIWPRKTLLGSVE